MNLLQKCSLENYLPYKHTYVVTKMLYSILVSKGGQVNFFVETANRKKIRKFLILLRNRKSANFLCVPVRKSQIRKLS